MMNKLRRAHKSFWQDVDWQSRAQKRWFGFCAVCLALYTAYAAYLSKSKLFVNAAETVASRLWFVVIAAVLYALMLYLVKKTATVTFRKTEARLSDPLFVGISLLISLAILGIAFAACYPGGVDYDTSNQWRQVQSGEFNNWHPLFHTLMIWLATRVVNSYPFVLLLQLLVFSAAMAYLSHTLRRCGVPGIVVLVAQALVVASAPVRNTLMYVGKDSAMTIGALLLCAYSVRLLYTRGAWLQKPINAALLGLVLAYTTLVRHNAMLYTVPLMVFVLFCYRPRLKRAAVLVGSFVLCLALVNGSLFGALDVVYPNNLLEESMGIPMTMMANAKKTNPDALDVETQAFLATLATDEEWQTVYKVNAYNSIKFTYDRELVKNVPLDQWLRMTLTTVQNDPRGAFQTFNAVTDLVWGLDDQCEGYESVRNSGELEEARYGSAKLNNLGSTLLAFMEAPLQLLPIRYLFSNIGVQLLLLLLVTLWALYRTGIRTLTLSFPILIYNLGTMLLLCNNDARFFQYAMAISVPTMLALLYAPVQKEN